MSTIAMRELSRRSGVSHRVREATLSHLNEDDRVTNVGPQRTRITPMQWSCLRDAADGKKIAPTFRISELWAETEDGAILHPARVVHALHQEGLLAKVSPRRYVATSGARQAAKLPVK